MEPFDSEKPNVNTGEMSKEKYNMTSSYSRGPGLLIWLARFLSQLMFSTSWKKDIKGLTPKIDLRHNLSSTSSHWAEKKIKSDL